MRAVWMRATAELRKNLRTSVLLALVIALGGGSVIAAAAGARRTDSAFKRMVRVQRTPELLAPRFPGADSFAQFDFGELGRLNGVAETLELRYFSVAETLSIMASDDPRYLHDFVQPKVIQGRLPALDRPDEMAVDTVDAQAVGARLGKSMTFDVHPALLDENAQPVRVPARVVGIIALAENVPPSGGFGHVIVASPAFVRTYGSRIPAVHVLAMRLRGGDATAPTVIAQINARAGGKPVTVFRQTEHQLAVDRAFHLQAVALWLLAGLAALAAFLSAGKHSCGRCSSTRTKTRRSARWG